MSYFVNFDYSLCFPESLCFQKLLSAVYELFKEGRYAFLLKAKGRRKHMELNSSLHGLTDAEARRLREMG